MTGLTRRRMAIALIVAPPVLFAVMCLAVLASPKLQTRDNLAMTGVALGNVAWPKMEDLLGIARSVVCPVLLLIAVGAAAWRRSWRRAATILGFVAMTLIVASLVRVGIPRPQFGVGLPPNTIPSGHVTVSLVAAVALVMVLRGWSRRVAQVLGGALAVFTGLGVQMVVWHRPSDSVGALLITAVCVGVAFLVWQRWERPATGTERARAGESVGAFLLCALGVFAGLVTLVVIGLRVTELAPAVRLHAAIFNGVYCIGVALLIWVTGMLFAPLERRPASR